MKMKFITALLGRALATLVVAVALVAGMLVSAPAANATTTADFTSTWSEKATANAEATAVSIAGADATGKILLQEERATMSDKDLKRMKPPTKAQIKAHGTVVHSMDQAQRVATKQIKTYDKLVHDASVTVRKLQLKLKYGDYSAKEKRVLKKKLKRAKSHLKAVKKDAEWKYRPLIRLTDGCFRNTGRRNNMVLQSFVECVKGNKAEIDLGFDPVAREMRVVGVMYVDGSMLKDPCENFAYFDIPPGTPNEDMFIVVEAFAKVILDVTVGVHVVGDLTVYGVMKQNGVVCDEETKVKHVDEMRQSKTFHVTDTDVDSAIAFGVNQVQADASARAEVQQSVKESITIDISQTMHLECASTTAPPQATAPFVNDVLVNNTRTITFTGKLAKGTYGFGTATAGTGTIQGSNRVALAVDNDGYFSVTFTYKAGAEPGTDTVTLVVDQSDGQSVTVKTKGKDASGRDVEYFQIRAIPPQSE